MDNNNNKYKGKRNRVPIEISDSQDEYQRRSKPQKKFHRDPYDGKKDVKKRHQARPGKREREEKKKYLYQNSPQKIERDYGYRKSETNNKSSQEKWKQNREQVSSEQDNVGMIRFGKDAVQTEKVSRKKVTPWIAVSTLEMKDSLLRFHNEIVDFYNYIRPSEQSHQLRIKALNEIKRTVEEVVPGVQIKVFGSFATKLYLPDSDIDIAIISKNLYEVTEIYNLIHRKMLKQTRRFKELEYIRKSKVPLIKFVYQCDGEQLNFDISVDKMDGIDQVGYVAKINQNYPEFKYLIFVFKCCLRIRGLSETYSGGIGSFLLTCMVLVFLQEMQRKKKYLTLGEHIIKFMSFYGEEDWSRKVVYVKNSLITDRSRDNVTFSMISPQDETHDIGKSAFKISNAFNLFRNRTRYIQGKNFAPFQSILSTLVNPTSQKFKYFKS